MSCPSFTSHSLNFGMQGQILQAEHNQCQIWTSSLFYSANLIGIHVLLSSGGVTTTWPTINNTPNTIAITKASSPIPAADVPIKTNALIAIRYMMPSAPAQAKNRNMAHATPNKIPTVKEVLMLMMMAMKQTSPKADMKMPKEREWNRMAMYKTTDSVMSDCSMPSGL